MTIVVLSDVVLDECVFFAGGGGKQIRRNDRSFNQGGYASANVINDVTLRQFELGVKPMNVSAWKEIEGVYEVTDAGAFGFLIKDPKDQTVLQSEGALQGYMSNYPFGDIGFGNGTPIYGLRKFYKALSSTRTRSRVITRPITPPAMLRGGSPVIIGGAAGNAYVTAGPAVVNFVADATRNITAVAVGSSTVVTLATAIPGFVVGGRIWLQNLSGADANLLNDKSHEITNIAGAIYTVATNTAGKTITASGEASKYPQPDETLSWSGDFYVPVQFASDDLDWDLVLPGDFEDRVVSAMSVTLLEVREA